MKKPGFITEYRGLNRSIYVLFAARIVNRMGDFVQLFLVFYLTARLGFDEAGAGRFIMMTGVMNGFGILLGGYVSDRFNRKAVLVFCQSVFAVSYLICGFLPVSMTVPWLIFISSSFRGATWPVTNAMVTDLTEGLERKRAFSLLYLGTNIGVAVGPILAGLLFANHLNWIFWGDAATTLFAAVVVLFQVPDTKPTKEKIIENLATRTDGERAEEGRFFSVFLRRPALITYLLIASLISFVYSQHQFSLPLQINELFSVKGPKIYGYIMTSNALIVLLFTAPLTSITKRLRSITNMAIAGALYFLGFGMILFTKSLGMFIVSTCIWTFGEILMVTNSNVFVASHTPITHRGRFNGMITWIHGIGFALSPWISGWVIEVYGISAIWPVVSAVAFAGAASYWIMSIFLKKGKE
ncbi:MAG: MFS transporter [Spirochaetia bacterium]|nr:MFS transporter [Spirochaetia bacterium]